MLNNLIFSSYKYYDEHKYETQQIIKSYVETIDNFSDDW